MVRNNCTQSLTCVSDEEGPGGRFDEFIVLTDLITYLHVL